MADQNTIIAATVQVDTAAANTNVKELTKSTTSLKGSLSDVGTTAKKAGKEAGEAGGSFGKLKEQMSALPGPLGEASEGVNKLGKTFKALLASPVVLVIAAIVAGLAFLYKAFTNTFEGGQKVEQVFAGIKAAAEVVVDRILDLGGAVIKFFSGDFKGALSDAKKAVTGIGDEVSATYNRVAELTKQVQKLTREQSTDDLEKKKRETRLALLREQLNDESVSIKDKKKIATELRDDQIANAKEDLERTTKLVGIKIELQKVGKDAEEKNLEEINKLQGEIADVQTQNALEGVRTNKVIRNLDKQQKAEDKAAAAEGIAAAKAARQILMEFTNKLTKLQQENELLLIKDGYEKEKKLLENKIADQKRAEELAFKDRKINKEQYAKLVAAIDVQANLEKINLDKKHNEEVLKKEEAFEKELTAITKKTRLDAIVDVRKLELATLQVGYEEKLQQAIITYKDDQKRFIAIKAALDVQLKADQEKAAAKFAKEDAKKKFELAEQEAKLSFNDPKTLIKDKINAINIEQALIQKAFDDKILSEVDFNNKQKELVTARMTITDLETANKQRSFDIISQGLNAFGDLIGRNTTLGKAAAVAATIINTYQAAWSIFANAAKNPSTIPFPAYPYIQAGIAIVAGLKTVQSIVSVKTPGGGSGSAPSSGSAAAPPSAPLAPTQNGTRIDQKSIAGIGNATSGRAYVLDSDVRSHAERNVRLNRAARLGG